MSETVTEPPVTTCPNSVLGKTHSILESFGQTNETLRLAELSLRSGVPKASVYRLAEELVGLGLLEKIPAGYRLGLGVFTLGQRVDAAASLRASARPILVDLCAATGSTTHLAVLRDHHTVYLEKMGGTRSIHTLSHVGGRLPVTCTASGKLLLALSGEREVELRALETSGLTRMTRHSISSLAELRTALDAIEASQLATEDQEALLGYRSFAVPVKDRTGLPVAALSATVPVGYERTQNLVSHLRAAAAAISRHQARSPVDDRVLPGSGARRTG